MELTKEQKNPQELLQKIISKAWGDETFKNELLVDPINAIEKAIGEYINLPKGKTLIVKDQMDASTIYINIPAEPMMEDMELNEGQLEAIAGGKKGNYSFFHIPTLPVS